MSWLPPSPRHRAELSSADDPQRYHQLPPRPSPAGKSHTVFPYYLIYGSEKEAVEGANWLRGGWGKVRGLGRVEGPSLTLSRLPTMAVTRWSKLALEVPRESLPFPSPYLFIYWGVSTFSPFRVYEWGEGVCYISFLNALVCQWEHRRDDFIPLREPLRWSSNNNANKTKLL